MKISDTMPILISYLNLSDKYSTWYAIDTINSFGEGDNFICTNICDSKMKGGISINCLFPKAEKKPYKLHHFYDPWHT